MNNQDIHVVLILFKNPCAILLDNLSAILV